MPEPLGIFFWQKMGIFKPNVIWLMICLEGKVHNLPASGSPQRQEFHVPGAQHSGNRSPTVCFLSWGAEYYTLLNRGF